MKRKSIRVPEALWAQAMKKAGLTPLSSIVRLLIQMWLDGEIEIKTGGDTD